MKIIDNVKLEDGYLSSCVKVDRLLPGETIKLPENHVMVNKRLTLSFRIDELKDGEIIKLGHGEKLYCSAHLELSATDFKIYEYLTDYSVLASAEHGLKLSGFVNIVIETGYGASRVTISTASGVYMGEWMPRTWSGRNGQVFAYSETTTLEDVTLRWYAPDLQKDIWLFGDSYFSTTSDFRWPYYLVKAGYTNFMISGFPGRDSVSALLDFKNLLTYAQPKFAVWCLGMNDMDDDETVNPRYKASVDEFLSICSERGIIPILSTVPCVPERSNYGKNKLVRESGYRYIDFAKAVGGEEKGSPWIPGMLCTDMVHPDKLGAMALYTAVITDFPEIMS